MTPSIDGGGSSEAYELAKKRKAIASKRPKPLLGDSAGSTTQGRASGLYGLPKAPSKTYGVPDPQKVKGAPGSAVLPGGRGQVNEEQQLRLLIDRTPKELSPSKKMAWLLGELVSREKAGKQTLVRGA